MDMLGVALENYYISTVVVMINQLNRDNCTLCRRQQHHCPLHPRALRALVNTVKTQTYWRPFYVCTANRCVHGRWSPAVTTILHTATSGTHVK